ncbi:hypothetical protein D1P53_000811 [Cryptococcus gattii VGV]|nr:hypothetical protein D1P53_000811 [Cryptococcus gattii VGV]
MSFYPSTERGHASVRHTDFKYIHPTSTTQAPSACNDPSCRDPHCGLGPISRVSTMPTPSGRHPSNPCSDSRCNDPRCFAATTRRSTEPLAPVRQGGSAVYPNFPHPINSGGWEDNEHFSENGGYGRRDSIYSSYISPDIPPTPTSQSFQTRSRRPNSRRNSTEVYDSPLAATASSSRTACGSREYEEWTEYNEARLRSMSIEETVEVEEYGDPYDYRPVTSENRRRRHQRINDGGAGTGSLSSRHARDERSTRPQKSQRETYSDDKKPRKPPQRQHCRPFSSEMTTYKRNKDGIDITIDDKTIIIFQNGNSAHITMSDLPPGDEGDDEVYNDRAIAGRVDKWMERNEAYYSQSGQPKLALPAPPTTRAASHSGKSPISSTASRTPRSYRSIPLKYYSEDTTRPNDITFHLEIPGISTTSSKNDWVDRAMAPVGRTIDEEFADLSPWRRDRLVVATWQHMDHVYEWLMEELTESLGPQRKAVRWREDTSADEGREEREGR